MTVPIQQVGTVGLRKDQGHRTSKQQGRICTQLLSRRSLCAQQLRHTEVRPRQDGSVKCWSAKAFTSNSGWGWGSRSENWKPRCASYFGTWGEFPHL